MVSIKNVDLDELWSYWEGLVWSLLFITYTIVSEVPRGFLSRWPVIWFPVVIISGAREMFERLGLRVTLESVVCSACLFCIHSSVLYSSSILQCLAKSNEVDRGSI